MGLTLHVQRDPLIDAVARKREIRSQRFRHLSDDGLPEIPGEPRLPPSPLVARRRMTPTDLKIPDTVPG